MCKSLKSLVTDFCGGDETCMCTNPYWSTNFACCSQSACESVSDWQKGLQDWQFICQNADPSPVTATFSKCGIISTSSTTQSSLATQTAMSQTTSTSLSSAAQTPSSGPIASPAASSTSIGLTLGLALGLGVPFLVGFAVLIFFVVRYLRRRNVSSQPVSFPPKPPHGGSEQKYQEPVYMYSNQENATSPSAPSDQSMQQWPYSPATLSAPIAFSPVSNPSDHTSLHSPDIYSPSSMPPVDAGRFSVNGEGNELSQSTGPCAPPAYSSLNRSGTIATISKFEMGDTGPLGGQISRSRHRQAAEHGPFELGTASH